MKKIFFFLLLASVRFFCFGQHGNVVTRDSVNHCFDTGDKPTQQQFWNWQKSILFPAEDTVINFYRGWSSRSDIIGGQYAGNSGSLTGSPNVFLGKYAGYSNTTGWGNHFIGYKTGYSNTTGYRNIFIGDSVGRSNTVGFRNIIIGNNATQSATASNFRENIMIGDSTGYNITGSSASEYNIFIGNRTGRSATQSTNNLYIGHRTGDRNLTNSGNVFLGSSSGRDTRGDFNTFVGYLSGREDSTGVNNVFVGKSCGMESGSSYSTYLGFESGRKSEGNYNVFIGYQAGYSETSSNKLYVDNSNTATPLIYGNFSSNQVTINTSLSTDSIIINQNLKIKNATIISDYVTVASGDSILLPTNIFCRADFWDVEDQSFGMMWHIDTDGEVTKGWYEGAVWGTRLAPNICLYDYGAGATIVNLTAGTRKIGYMLILK